MFPPLGTLTIQHPRLTLTVRPFLTNIFASKIVFIKYIFPIFLVLFHCKRFGGYLENKWSLWKVTALANIWCFNSSLFHIFGRDLDLFATARASPKDDDEIIFGFGHSCYMSSQVNLFIRPKLLSNPNWKKLKKQTLMK